MPILQLWGARALQRLKRILTQIGAFDLPSIITGVVVVGILAAGVLAAVFGVIPFAQDKAAQQDLDSVRTSEGVAKSRLDGYKNKAGLLDAGIISDAATLAVSTDAAGSCFVGISKSSTGTIFFNSDKTTRSEILTATTETGCIDAATRDALIVEVGGFGPAGPVAGGPIDTDGDGIPDSEDPTPNGEGGSGDPYADSAGAWSTTPVSTNRIIDPSFENNANGWSIPRTVRSDGGFASSAKTVTWVGNQGIDSEGAVKMTTSGVEGANYAYFELPPHQPGSWVGAMNVSVYSDISQLQGVYVNVVNFAPDGTFLLETGTSYVEVNSAKAWQSMRVSVPWQDWANPVNVKRYLQVAVYGGSSPGHLENANFFVDHVSLGENDQYFDGDTLAAGEYSYRWAGLQNASESEQHTTKQVIVPSFITLGQDFTVTGRGYPANTLVRLEEYENSYGATSVTTDSSGNFTVTMNIPAGTETTSGAVPGAGSLTISAGSGARLYPEVTFQ